MAGRHTVGQLSDIDFTTEGGMSLAEMFPEITKLAEPLAAHTHLRIGGPVEFMLEPRSIDELRRVLSTCQDQQIPVRMLGRGFNLLVRDDPIPGAVIRLTTPAFTTLSHEENRVTAGGGGQLFDLIAFSIRNGLAGLETLVGIRGSVGGSVRCNVGDRAGEIGQTVSRVTVLTESGAIQTRDRDQLNFSEHQSDLDEPVILTVEFELESDESDAILKRTRKAWAMRKGSEPFSFQHAARLFHNPPGKSAASLIDRAGLTKTRNGGAELSERNANYVIAHPGSTAADILHLVEHVRDRVRERTGIALDRELHVW